MKPQHYGLLTLCLFSAAAITQVPERTDCPDALEKKKQTLRLLAKQSGLPKQQTQGAKAALETIKSHQNDLSDCELDALAAELITNLFGQGPGSVDP